MLNRSRTKSVHYFKMLICLFFALLNPTSQLQGEEWYGDYVGDLADRAENAEIINGQVYVVNNTCLQIIDFFYDAAHCSQAYFWLNGSAELPSNGRKVHTFEYGDQYIGSYKGARVILNTPFDTTLSDFGSLSLWCQAKRSSITYVPVSNLSPPAAEHISTHLKTTESGSRYHLRAGPFTIMDVRTIKVYGFSISTKSPDTYFVIGSGPVRNKRTIIKVPVRHWDIPGQKVQPLPKISRKISKDLILDLPEYPDIYDIDWLAVYCERYFSDFGYVEIRNLSNHIPPYLSTPYNNLVSKRKSSSAPWPKTSIFLNDSTNELKFQLGPPGGTKGYFAWFGVEPAKYVWYVNGLMAPEIVLEADTVYSLRIEGGNDEKFKSFYHPLYITDDSKGGYSGHTLEEKRKINIYAGEGSQRISKNDQYTGRACIFIEREGTEPENYHSFSAYSKNLRLRCTEGEPGRFLWKPSIDLVGKDIFYQSFSTSDMGGRITVTMSKTLAPTTAVSLVALKLHKDSTTPSAASSIYSLNVLRFTGFSIPFLIYVIKR